MRSFRGALLVLTITLLLAGCGGSGGTNPGTTTGGGGTSPNSATQGIKPFASDAIILKAPTADATFRLPDGTTVVAASDELLLEVEEDVTAEEMADIEKAVDAHDGTIVGQVPGASLLELQFPPGADLVALDETLSALPGVAGVDLNERVDADQPRPAAQAALLDPVAALRASAIPQIPTFDGDYWVEQCEAIAGWTLLDTWGATLGPVVGVADGGFNRSVKALTDSRVTVFDSAGTPITETDCDVAIQHGTKVASCAAGSGRTGTYGMCWTSPVVSVKCLGDASDGYVLNTAAAIETAVRKGARVVNVSIGAITSSLTTESAFYAARQRFRDRLTGALDFARRNNVLVCFSAGNDGRGNPDYTDPIKHDDQLLPSGTKSSTTSWTTHALIVANSTSSRTIAPSSREGKVVDLAAPGTSVGVDVTFGKVTTFSGTSYSTPFTSGVAAAILSMVNGLTPTEVRAVILTALDPDLTSVGNALGLLNYRRAAASGLSFRNVPTASALSATLTKDQTATLDVAVTAGKPSSLDVMFLIDVSKANQPALANLKAAAPRLLAALRARVPDTQVALATFSDFPTTPYGAAGDTPWTSGCTFTTDDATLSTAFNALAVADGGDDPNAQWSTLRMAASGRGVSSVPPQLLGYRGAAMKIVVLVTCTPFHDADTETAYPGSGRTAVVSLLRQRGFTLIGVNTDNPVGDLDTAVTMVGGRTVDSAGAADIDVKVGAALDQLLASETLTLLPVGDAESFVTSISPTSYASVPGGQARTFRVTLTGRKRAGVSEQQYPSVLWGVANGSGVLSRVPLTVKVPAE